MVWNAAFSWLPAGAVEAPGGTPPGLRPTEACFNPGRDFYFFSLLEWKMGAFKYFPIVIYKSEWSVYSFTF